MGSAQSTGAQRPQSATVVAGRLTDPSGQPIAGVEVLTNIETPAVTVSGPDGRFRLILPASDTTTKVFFRATGYRLAVQSLLRDGGRGERIDVALVLQPAVTTLAATTIVAVRPRESRDITGRARLPGDQAATLESGAGLSGDLSGDLAVAAGMLPGVSSSVSADGSVSVSAYGVDARQNGSSLNGSNGAPTRLPRDGLVQVVRLSSYDPRVGRYAGLQFSNIVPSGSFLSVRTLRLTAEHPVLQWAPATDASPNAMARDLIVSGTAAGPLGGGGRYFNTAFQLGERAAPALSLEGLDPARASSLGLSADSLRRMLSVARAVGVPVDVGGGASALRATTGSLVSRLDLTPSAQLTGDQSGDVLYLLVAGSGRHAQSLGASPTASSARASRGTQWDMGFLADWSPYLKDALLEVQTKLSRWSDRVDPVVAAPGATVTLTSAQPDGRLFTTPVQLGGNGGSSRSVEGTGWEMNVDAAWRSLGGAHRFNAFLSSEYRRLDDRRDAGRLGDFSYASLSDFAAGRPSRYTRSLTGSSVSSAMWQGAAGIGDVVQVWSAPHDVTDADVDGLTLRYGVRVEGERFLSAPELNPGVTSAFGVRTNSVPSAWALLPMLGFSWRQGRFAEQSGPTTISGSRSLLEGGTRLYRASQGLADVIDVLREAGIAGGVPRLDCIGASVPAPDWRALSAGSGGLPVSCLPGTSGALADTVPSTKFYSPDYRAPLSWRSELNWRWRFSGSLSGFVGASYAMNSNQAQLVDINIATTPRFVLAGEAGRPVYAALAGIDGASGQVSASSARAFPAIGRVNEVASDLRSEQRQLTAGFSWLIGTTEFVSPLASNPSKVSGGIRAWYSHTAQQGQSTGFSNSTAGDPRRVEWTRGAVPTHAIQLAVDLRIDRWISVSAVGRVGSGLRYTPLVGADINGDGLLNDRAFVHDPATVNDSGVRLGLTRLLATAPLAVRRCLVSQLGHVAQQNSCEGPWSATLGTIAVRVDPYRIGLGGRGSLTLYIHNVLGGIDLLLHGASQLRGWGQPAVPDAVLLWPTGFDSSARSFRYALNPAFGSVDRNRTVSRVPTGLSLDFRLDVGTNLESQALEAFVMHGQGETRMSGATLEQTLIASARRYSAGDLERLLGVGDSLALSPVQRREIERIAAGIRRTQDSVYHELAAYLSDPSTELSSPEARQRWHSAIVHSIRSAFRGGAEARAHLSSTQIEWLQRRHMASTLVFSEDWLERTTRGAQLLPR